jgi:hypothetical protein
MTFQQEDDTSKKNRMSVNAAGSGNFYAVYVVRGATRIYYIDDQDVCSRDDNPHERLEDYTYAAFFRRH